MARIAVLGAGVAGLTAAYKLRQAGHEVTVLEAKPWAGGLSQTARNGTMVIERHDDELLRQTANLPDGHYINMGPGRLPHHHRRILGLCRELGVPLEPYIMTSDANLYASTKTGKKYRRRRLENDVRGYVSALAWDSAFEQERDMLREYGALSEDGRYLGTDRAGDGDVVPMTEIMRSNAWRHQLFQPLNHFWQDVLFQPVGGMDQIWRHLLATGIQPMYNAPVKRIALRGSRVNVTWDYGGARTSETFDWCLSSVPLPLLSGDVELQGFPADYREAIDGADFAAACKVGWYSRERWWEDEEIYGGISYTDHDIWQMWYPSSGHFGSNGGTLTGTYNSYDAAERLQSMDVPDRLALAREGGRLLHEQIADTSMVPTENAATIAWQHVPYQSGGWCDWRKDKEEHHGWFQRLQEPAGRFLGIGDQLSPWPGWQEGCVLTADRAVDVVNGDHSGAPTWLEAPHAPFLTTGDHPAISYTY